MHKGNIIELLGILNSDNVHWLTDLTINVQFCLRHLT